MLVNQFHYQVMGAPTGISDTSFSFKAGMDSPHSSDASLLLPDFLQYGI